MMRRNILLAVVTMLSGSSLLLAATPKEELAQAAKSLGDKPNYSWQTTVEVPEGTPFRPGPTEGKTQKGGPTTVSLSFGDITTRAVIQGENAAVTSAEGEWRSASDLENEEGPGRFLGMIVRNTQTPADQAADLIGHVQDWKKDGNVYSGELTEEGAAEFIRFRRRRSDGDGGPTVVFAKGSAKFWIADGLLQKYEYKVDGSMDFNGNEFEIVRTTTVEIKDVGTTRIEVPEEAKARLN